MSLSSTAQSMAGMRKTLAPAGIAATGTAAAAGAQHASAAQQSFEEADSDTGSEHEVFEEAVAGADEGEQQDAWLQQSSAAGMAISRGRVFDMQAFETLKWG
jgi:hypothetical protein